MSVVGIDFGNLNTVVAVARNRGIDVITNEVSNRATPSLVSFGDKQRYMGEAAKTQEISIFKSTVSTLKRLIGRPFSDPEILAIEQKFVNAKLVASDRGEVGAEITFQGESRTFSATQLAAMFFGKVKEFTQKEIKGPMTDCVISCPGWYNDRQRRAIRDAAEIAGLNCLRVLNDLTAAALGYGITKLDLPDPTVNPSARPRNVIFVDLGHSSYQVSIVSFVKGKLVVKSAAYDHTLGGRNFDEVLVDQYVKEFDTKYKMNIRANPKALFRLRQACEKVKKILSANSVTLLNVESLLDDKDVSAQVQKADYSEWVKPLFDRLVAPVTRALKAAGMEASEIDFVELVGGSTRIPAVKEFLNEYFKGPNGEQKISTTLNQDEAVARGCALQCAMISPVFKVRDFAVQDWNTFPVSLHWDPSIVPPSKSGEIPDTTIEVFATGNSAPSAKVLTFYRAMSDDELAKHNGAVSFDIDALYGVGPEALPFVENNYIGKFSVRGIRKLASDTTEGPLKAVIKLKARLDGSNIISLDSAQQIEEVLVPEEEKKEEKKDEKKDDGKSEQKGAEAMETDEAQPAQPKMKKVTRKHDLTIISATSALSQELLGEWRSLELSMEAGDRLVVDTAERRNQLEEYVYHVRGQLEMAWSDFVTDADREALNAELNEMEDWLYGDGEDATKSVYIEKHDLLKKKGDPIAARFRDAEDRPRAEKLFREYCNSVAISLSSDDDRYAHIPSTDIDKVRDEVTKKLGWLNDTIAALHESPKHVNPTVTVAGINREREALMAFVTPILNKPKPAPPKKEETPAPEPSAAAADQKPAAAEAGEGAAAPEPNADATKEAPSMDVD